jgi:cell wall-associated NlpC family hydrolase
MVGLACGVAVTTMALEQPAGADPRPSVREVTRHMAKARAQVRDRAAEVGRTAARLAAAKARLDELSATAESAVEAYNRALVRLAQAQDAYRAAVRRAAEADRRVAEQRRAVVALATEGYARGLGTGYGGVARPAASFMSSPAGMSGYLYRTSMLVHLSGGQAAVLQRMRDAQAVAALMRAQANRAYTAQQNAAAQAEAAKRAAEEAVREQIKATRKIEVQKAALEKRLEQARGRAERLARARAAARERARLRHLPGKARRDGDEEQSDGEGLGDIAADWALEQLGKPYVWAADGPDSFDCSGLTMRAWQRAGVRLDHWTGTQWTSGPHIPLDELRRGDLLFFGRITSDPGTIHHVGIYIGHGLMVHAPQTGDVVRVASIHRRDLVGATRPGG